jgi:hypothetical protein
MAWLLLGTSTLVEYGPRNCIEQDLAMVEGKNSEEGVHNNMAVTSVPCNEMRIKVKKLG